MYSLRISLLIFALVSSIAVQLPGQSRNNGSKQDEGDLTVYRDVAYVNDGHERQKLDLYVPKDTLKKRGKLPLVIWVHGGAWQKGSKRNCRTKFLTKHGYAVASINYRLIEHARFPAQIEDCQSAVQYLRSNAKKYGLDPNRFGACGSSAGGHLVAMLGTVNDREFLDSKRLGVSSRVQAVVDFFGPTELLTLSSQSGPDSKIDHDAADSPGSLLIGGTLQETKELARQASPMTHVSANDAPILIIHGESDRLVPVQQSKDFHAALQKSGVDSTLEIVAGAGHGWIKRDKQLVGFFDRILKAPAKPGETLSDGLIFQATFDGTTDANLFDQDGWIYTAENLKRKKYQRGNHIDSVSIAKGEGVSGDCLRFSKKTKEALFYRAAKNSFVPVENWSGTISFWLKLDPDNDLEPGYCDPLIVTQNAWNDGAIWVDFDKELPRAFRLGCFSDFKTWNPNKIDYEKIPEEERPLVSVSKPKFSSERWTHVAMTFSNINSTSKQIGMARLYLDGKLQGEVKRNFRFSWKIDPSEKGYIEPAIALGINYIGDMDELMIYNRPLGESEVLALNKKTKSGK